jgi:hypothetical protein
MLGRTVHVLHYLVYPRVLWFLAFLRRQYMITCNCITCAIILALSHLFIPRAFIHALVHPLVLYTTRFPVGTTQHAWVYVLYRSTRFWNHVFAGSSPSFRPKPSLYQLCHPAIIICFRFKLQWLNCLFPDQNVVESCIHLAFQCTFQGLGGPCHFISRRLQQSSGARKVLGWPKKCKLAHAFQWECS